MGKGPALAVAGLLTFSLALSASVASAGGSKLLVNEDSIQQNRPGVVHAVVDLRDTDADASEIHLRIEGPGSSERIVERHPGLGGSGPHLVTIPWTPLHAGNHALQTEVLVGEERRELAERTVFVTPAGSGPEATGGVLPHTAPGTVQWAIAFGFLFFVTRASLGRR